MAPMDTDTLNASADHGDAVLSRGISPFWARWLRPTEILSALALIGALIAVLGWHIQSPADSIRDIELRLARAEKRIDTVFTAIHLTNYMQCVAFRTDHPELLPPECPPIIESRKSR